MLTSPVVEVLGCEVSRCAMPGTRKLNIHGTFYILDTMTVSWGPGYRQESRLSSSMTSGKHSVSARDQFGMIIDFPKVTYPR